MVESIARKLFERMKSKRGRKPEWISLPWEEIGSHQKNLLKEAQDILNMLRNAGLAVYPANEVVYLRRPVNPLRVRRMYPDGTLKIE